MSARQISSDSQASVEDNEVEILETQIMGLEEQLVVAIIENQNLEEQIKRCSKDLCERLHRQEEENRQLRNKLRELEKDKEPTVVSEYETSDDAKDKGSDVVPEKPRRSPSRTRFRWRRRTVAKSKSLDQSQFIASLALETSARPSKAHLDVTSDCLRISSSRISLVKRIEKWLSHIIWSFLEDFSELNDEDGITCTQEGDPLTVKKLKENVVRFSSIMQPLNSSLLWMTSLFHWESPAATFLFILGYFGSLFTGYTVTMFLFFALIGLTLNYIRKRGWFNKFRRSPSNGEKAEESNGDQKLGDRFVVVLQVARRVQNVLGKASDTAEKLKNLLLWEHEATSRLYVMLLMMLLASLVLWPSQLCTLFAVYVGIKLFFVDFIFYKFPRIRRKYDSTSKLWDSLPTDAQLGKRTNKNGSCRTDDNSFLELFNLPPTEVPLDGWQTGKRCTLVNRDKSLTSAFRNGRLYLTNSFLCFERNKWNPEKNVKLAICDVVNLEKANSYPWIPGGGMAIEIMAASGKTYFLAGILNRDEVFDAILDSCRRSSYRCLTIKDKEKEKEKENDKAQEKGKTAIENEENGTEKRKDVIIAPESSGEFCNEIVRPTDSEDDVTEKENVAIPHFDIDLID